MELVEESISRSAYAFPLTRVQIFVPKELLDQALELLKPFDDIELGENKQEK